ncbi:MATE efflux family protein ALF5 [Gossypium arboreum]|uniref:MATE efflux family protein ALF5 n=1 Tax=Gossypium arboreum TaxID=29729 RepID=A0A0B0NP52_GOSAR|nr:MATE efflux family protein ALF5 [Gossypium arboreum]
MASLEVEEKPSEVKQNAIWGESKKMWAIAGPAILVSVSQFSIGFVTVAFAGHLGELELAAVTITTNVIEGFVFGIMLGMGSALETLCGQAVGAGQHNMLGIYLQRSWIITGITALCLTPCYLLATPILNLLRQDKAISELAGKYCKMVIPQFFAYAMNFPIQKFLQSQTKVWVMTIISIIGLGCHVLLNWALVTKLEFGLLGAAMAGNISWWLQVIAMVIYVVAGLNLQLWTSMVTLGFNIAASVRVSNELGAGRPKAAKFSIVVVVLTSLAVGVIFMAIILATKHDFPKLFTDKQLVIKAASKLGYFLAATIFLNSILPVLHGKVLQSDLLLATIFEFAYEHWIGVAVGAGWQAYVGLINITCYYLLGIPGGALLGFKFKLRVQGIWFGMLIGTVLQTTILLFVMLRATWRKEAVQAEERLRTWGGPTETPNISLESNSAG